MKSLLSSFASLAGQVSLVVAAWSHRALLALDGSLPNFTVRRVLQPEHPFSGVVSRRSAGRVMQNVSLQSSQQLISCMDALPIVHAGASRGSAFPDCNAPLLSGSLSLGAPSKRDSKKAPSGQAQQVSQQQRVSAAAQGLAAQERQRSAGSSMLTSFFGRFGKSAASTPVRSGNPFCLVDAVKAGSADMVCYSMFARVCTKTAGMNRHET